jgi:hypothetical protein
MYTVLNKGTQETYTFNDNDIREQLATLFPGENKHFYTIIMLKITKEKYFNNYQFTITHNTYSAEKNKIAVNKKLHHFAGVPRNDTPVKRDSNHNQWMLVNSQNGKSCIFNNLAAVARALDVQYVYLYNGICHHPVFAVGKYRFSRNTKLERDHVYDLLVDVL